MGPAGRDPRRGPGPALPPSGGAAGLALRRGPGDLGHGGRPRHRRDRLARLGAADRRRRRGAGAPALRARATAARHRHRVHGARTGSRRGARAPLGGRHPDARARGGDHRDRGRSAPDQHADHPLAAHPGAIGAGPRAGAEHGVVARLRRRHDGLGGARPPRPRRRTSARRRRHRAHAPPPGRGDRGRRGQHRHGAAPPPHPGPQRDLALPRRDGVRPARAVGFAERSGGPGGRTEAGPARRPADRGLAADQRSRARRRRPAADPHARHLATGRGPPRLPRCGHGDGHRDRDNRCAAKRGRPRSMASYP